MHEYGLRYGSTVVVVHLRLKENGCIQLADPGDLTVPPRVGWMPWNVFGIICAILIIPFLTYLELVMSLNYAPDDDVV